MRKTKGVILILAVAIMLSAAPIARTEAFTPKPETEYAASFITACENQQWFIDEVERILNANQKTLDTIGSSDDLDIIKSLGFKNKGIAGVIPKAIGELKELRTLFLSGNKLSGEIPPELFALPKLYNIDISENSYTGPIPAGFGTMTALEILMLRGNQYTGSIPGSILGNKTIKTLDISGNRLSGPIPAGINNMTGLTSLMISDNPWTAGALPDLSALTGLITLSMWKCNITGEIPEYIYSFTKLQVLDLADNRLTGTISGSIENLGCLQLLALGRNQLSGTVPEEFAGLTGLDTLDISDNKLRGLLPELLAEIRLVYAQNNYLTGEVLKGLEDNRNNFCDGAATVQYQLTAATMTARMDAEINVYLLLANKPLTSGSAPGKPVLPAGCYEAWIENDPEGKAELTFDDKGIYIKALESITTGEGVTVVIMILGNDGSVYSTVRLTVSTSPPVQGGMGTLTVSSAEGEEEIALPESETHGPYISGYPDGTFGPERTITREEVATLIIRAMGISTEDSVASTSYIDVMHNRWSAVYIEKANEKGFVTGYPDGAFKPGQEMTRAELATLLIRIVRVYGGPAFGEEGAFHDVHSGQWYAEYIHEAAARSLVSGYEDGTFKPDRTITRAEAVTMMNRMLGRDPGTAPGLHAVRNPFSDVDMSHWAYAHIMEAGTEHEHPCS